MKFSWAMLGWAASAHAYTSRSQPPQRRVSSSSSIHMIGSVSYLESLDASGYAQNNNNNDENNNNLQDMISWSKVTRTTNPMDQTTSTPRRQRRLLPRTPFSTASASPAPYRDFGASQRSQPQRAPTAPINSKSSKNNPDPTLTRVLQQTPLLPRMNASVAAKPRGPRQAATIQQQMQQRRFKTSSSQDIPLALQSASSSTASATSTAESSSNSKTSQGTQQPSQDVVLQSTSSTSTASSSTTSATSKSNNSSNKTPKKDDDNNDDDNDSSLDWMAEIRDALDALWTPVPRKTPPPTPPPPVFKVKGMTERIMKRIPIEQQASGAGGASTWDAFQRAEQNWARIKAFQPFVYDPRRSGNNNNGNPPPATFVSQDIGLGNPQCWLKLREQYNTDAAANLDYDIIVCGGTLGIFFASALQLQGNRVCVIEAGELRGREQEWNLSMDELSELVKLGVLTQQDVDDCIQTEFPGCRSGFKNTEQSPLEGGYFDNGIGYECFTKDVLNLGVSPKILLERAAAIFVKNGGTIRDRTRLGGVTVSEAIGAAVDLGPDTEPLTAKLVVDCMGNGSPISRQQRHGQKPDGICVVVGSCAAGFDPETNRNGDLIYTNQGIADKGRNGRQQYFWEAFPVGIGRNGKESSNVKTTYMFTYMDAGPERPSLESIMEDYWASLPVYQPSITNPETDLDFKRVLFAYFPTYRDSPLKPQWSRVLAVGDASGIQSPLSFGGFGALTRHLGRISKAVTQAVQLDLLHKDDLGTINAYTPNLSAAWMFQKAMSVKPGQMTDADFVNRLLAVNFEVMDDMGQRTIKPFLQDVVRFDGLVGSLARCFAADPFFMPQIIGHVGLPQLVDWVGHVSQMGAYSLLHNTATPFVRPLVDKMVKDERQRFLWERRMEAWEYGSGNDYVLPSED